MSVVLEEFFRDLDHEWRLRGDAKIVLQLIGSTALMLQTDYARGTKDSDVLETIDLTREIKAELESLAGIASQLFERHRLYVQIVASGIPFLPQGPLWHSLTPLNATLDHFEIDVLDVVDIVVSELKRAHADDMADVAAMVERDLVPHARLIERFRSAVDMFLGDARESELPRYVAALHRAERDFFDVPPTEIELPEPR